MLRITRYNLTHLLDFTGRDARPTFWYYVLFLFLVNIAIGMVLGFVLVGGLISAAIDAAQTGASEQEMQARMSAQMGGMMAGVVWYSLVANIIMSLLLAASFVRRLHDSNSSGWWGLLVLAAQVAGFVVSLQMMDGMQQIMAEMMSRTEPMSQAEIQILMQQQSEMGRIGLVGWIAPLVVIVFGVMDSTDGPNKFGEGPVRIDNDRYRVTPQRRQPEPGRRLTGPSPSPPDTRPD
jgi:uncharacterized membrane protein YhaH (DUF805 family)